MPKKEKEEKKRNTQSKMNLLNNNSYILSKWTSNSTPQYPLYSTGDFAYHDHGLKMCLLLILSFWILRLIMNLHIIAILTIK
jgi:hypothetical protein